MPEAEREVRASLEAVLANVEHNQRIYGWFAGDIRDLARATVGLDKKVDRRFDQLDKKIDQLDSKVTKQIDQLDSKVTKQIDQLDKATDLRIGVVHDDVRQVIARLEQLAGLIINDELKDQNQN